MGSALSEPVEVPDQIFRSANTSKRRTWLKSTDVMDIRLSTNAVDDLFASTFYTQYLSQCQTKRDVSQLYPNEEFQMTVDSLEENPAMHAADLEGVAQKHLHDVIDVVVDIVDDFAGELHKPVHTAPGVGRAFVERGFFFFVWDSYIGEKFGRLELRNCRRLMELQMMTVHVPLTYHIVYKGRGATVQSLIPLDYNSRMLESDSSELHCLAREICSALCLSGYEEDRVSYFLSSQVQAHLGRDGRIYFLQNAYWSPPWLSSKGDRLSPEQRFSCMRTELLCRKGSPMCCRAFQKDALASENASGIMVMRKLLDYTLHDVPRVLGSVHDNSPDSILVRFRKLGFNYSMLGWLLLSLFRNISPPAKAVRAILTEMFIRGIKQFIMWRSQPPYRSGVRDDDRTAAATEVDFDAVLHTMDGAGSKSFIDDVEFVLKAFLEYQGAPQPKPATVFRNAIPPPIDLFGAEVIPHIYRKFRLLPQDVDLYGKMDDEQKWEVYQRVCASLGVAVLDGKIHRVYPIVAHPGVPRTSLPEWVLHRTDALIRKLLRHQASRADWIKYGPALIPLLRLQPQNLPFYPQLEKVLTTLQQAPVLTFHVLQACFVLPALHMVIYRREECVQSHVDRHVLVHLYRKRAFAYFDDGKMTDAADQMRQALAHGQVLLEALGNSYSTQFRRLTSEYAFYVQSNDLHIELNMIRLLSRYCEPDVYIADDFLQLAVTKIRKQMNAGGLTAVDEMELEWDLSRAIRLYAEKLGDHHPKTLRAMANLAILWLETGKDDDAKIILESLAVESPNCPPDVKEIAYKLQHPNEPWNNVVSIPTPTEIRTTDPLLFVLHAPKYHV